MLTALAFAGNCAQAEAQTTFVVDSVVTYDFAKAGAPAVTLNNFNLGWAFSSWENDSKTNSSRQDYKGYAVDDNSKAVGLPDDCHVWVRNPRLVQSIYDDGFNVTQDRNFVVDGLVDGSKVVFKYTTTNTDSTKQKMLYATSESGLTGARIGEDSLIAGKSTINSGDTILVDSAKFINSKGQEDGYISVMVYKGMLISSVSIIRPDTTFIYDFVKAGAPLTFTNANRNQSTAGSIYVYEGPSKADSNRNDFKGYTVDANSAAVGLPDACHVWQRTDRYSSAFTHNGLKVTNNRQWAIDGLDSADVVQIYYTTVSADSASQSILYATGATSGTVAFLDVSADTLANATVIASGASINVDATNCFDSKGNANGYIGLQTFKGMYISKVVITKRHIDDVATAIKGVDTVVERTDDCIYNLAGQRVGASYKGVVIRQGKKYIQK